MARTSSVVAGLGVARTSAVVSGRSVVVRRFYSHGHGPRRVWQSATAACEALSRPMEFWAGPSRFHLRRDRCRELRRRRAGGRPGAGGRDDQGLPCAAT
ncbi:hypothetical protein ACP4OV_021551 [Aristida adscensionis]